MSRLYFDYNASAPLAPGLAEKIQEWVVHDFKNPNSAHQEGGSAKSLIEKSRRNILNLLGAADKDRLYFTSGGTESNNTVLQSAFALRKDKKRILISSVEHSCVYNVAKDLEKKGAVLDLFKVNARGDVNLEEFKKCLGPDVFLVSFMLANNETGFLFPIQEMAALAREHGILFHTDAVCAIGKTPVSFSNLGVDYLTFSSHKFGGLKGNGGTLVRSTAPYESFILGGTQEDGKRAGTQNVLGIASTAFALEKSLAHLAEHIRSEAACRAKIRAGIREIYPTVVFHESEKNLPQTLNVSFPKLSGTVLLANLDLEGIAASFGSACASGSLEISRVIRSLELPFDEARSALRLSFGPSLTLADVDDFLERLARVITRMQEGS